MDRSKEDWAWTLLIMQPDVVTPELFMTVWNDTVKKKALPLLDQVKWTSIEEGLSAQIMHIGPYTEEGTAVEKLDSLMEKEGLEKNGKHHEIYLSDPRKAAPDKLRTIIRQPVRLK
ncbi:GyrI-like domain-containing protein [Paenibacillus eucommiae]|uniref:GyrI-like small molecule binding domain-containing protein n=1 Tax=Paenibacillus eucommiae TaxID=1355755 RepID=A0ABS4IXM0_9BACL|nr:GyrI-like domain-containing protein [Paenibacillus eucommiae]MBP1992313.1 hypothetical protein [Paenibacillus eucommiae]